MAQALDHERGTDRKHVEPTLDWRKKMSDHIAYALLVYTGLQIFVTIESVQTSGSSIAPYIALAVLVAIVIPACRMFEACWNRMSDEQAADPAYRTRYRKSVIALWSLAIGAPLLLTGAIRALTALA